MKAAYYSGEKIIRIGGAERIEPGHSEVEIKVAYAGICGTDLHIYHGHMDHRVKFPHIMGHEMSGTVSRIGEGVAGVEVGDHVSVMPLHPCGECPACRAGHRHICHHLKFLGIETPGAFQPYWTVPAHTLHKLPTSLSLKHGALIEPLAVACHDVRLGQVQAGEYVVVLGGGPIGTLISLVARDAGARVLVSEINAYRIQLLNELGISTCNPKEEDLLQRVQEDTGGTGADAVFEVTSSFAGAEIMTQLPRTRGRIVIVGIYNKPAPVDLFRFFWRELQLVGARVYEQEDFIQAISLADSGKLPIDKLITKVYPLEELEHGFKEMEGGGSAMKIVLNCSS